MRKKQTDRPSSRAKLIKPALGCTSVSIDWRPTNFRWIPRCCMRVPRLMLITPRVSEHSLTAYNDNHFVPHAHIHTYTRNRGREKERVVRTVANNLNNESWYDWVCERHGQIKMPFRRASRFRIYEITPVWPVLAEFQFQPAATRNNFIAAPVGFIAQWHPVGNTRGPSSKSVTICCG